MFEDQIRKYDNLVSQYKKIVSDKFCKQDFIEYNEILFSAHSKNPISSKTKDKIIIPINAKVASQTIFVTSKTSLKVTTPNISAIKAPKIALVPI
jgi:hypothetical protein